MPMENLFLGRTAEKTFVGAPTTVGTSMIARSGRHVQVRVPRRSMHVWDLSTKWVACHWLCPTGVGVDLGIHTACGSLPPPTRLTTAPMMAMARFAMRMEIHAQRSDDIRRYND